MNAIAAPSRAETTYPVTRRPRSLVHLTDVDPVDGDVDHLVAPGGQVLAHVVGSDGQLAVTPVDQDGELDVLGASEVDQRRSGMATWSGSRSAPTIVGTPIVTSGYAKVARSLASTKSQASTAVRP